MLFRKSELKDIEKIMDIINDAKSFLKNLDIDQWQNGYPNDNVIKQDILNGESYVICDGENIVGTTVISFLADENYKKIYNGKWIQNNDYSVIHRIAVKKEAKGRGVAKFIFDEAVKLTRINNLGAIRVDTHEKNIPMRSLIEKFNFTYCGIIIVSDGTERYVFEKVIC